MTNSEILKTNFNLMGLEYTKTEFDTFAGWKRRGFTIIKGSSAIIKTKIWKPTKWTDKDGEKRDRMILVNASYFNINQTKGEELKI